MMVEVARVDMRIVEDWREAEVRFAEISPDNYD